MVELDNLPIFLYFKTRKKGLISIIWQFLMLRQGQCRGRGWGTRPPPPPHTHTFWKNKIKLRTVEPQYNKGPRDWKNMFVIARFVKLYRQLLFHIALYFTITGVKIKKQFVSPRTLFWRFQCNIHFHKNSIFVGIRIFQHLNLLVVRFDPISLKHLSLQNCT